MKIEKLQNVLEKIGLTKNESRIYLTLLKTGQTKTGNLLKKAEIYSGRIYEILSSLERKGLVNLMIKNNVKYYEASDPKEILNFLDEKRVEINSYQKEANEIIPKLRELKKSLEPEQKSVVYTGFRGMKNVLFEILDYLDREDEVLGFGLNGYKKEKYNQMWLSWNREREKRKIKSRVIFVENETKYYKSHKKLKNNRVRILDSVKPGAFDIMGNKYLVLTEISTPSSVVITNKDIISSFMSMFDSLWESARG